MKNFKVYIAALFLYLEISWAYGQPFGQAPFQQQLQQQQQQYQQSQSGSSGSYDPPTNQELEMLRIQPPQHGQTVTLNEQDVARLLKMRAEFGIGQQGAGGNAGHSQGLGGGVGPQGHGNNMQGQKNPNMIGGGGGAPFMGGGGGAPNMNGQNPYAGGNQNGMQQAGGGGGNGYQSLNPSDSEEIASALREEINHAPAQMQPGLRNDLPNMVHNVEDHLARDAGYQSYSAFVNADNNHGNNRNNSSRGVVSSIFVCLISSIVFFLNHSCIREE